MSSFEGKKNIEDPIKSGLIIKVTAMLIVYVM